MAKGSTRKKPTKTRRLVRNAFREVARNEPRAVKRTRRKKGARAAKKQRIAIALSKARAKGAKIRKR